MRRALGNATRVGLAAAVLVSCAKPPPPRLAFVDSPIFAVARESSFGVIRGEEESVLGRREGRGFVVARYVRGPEQRWEADCQSEPIIGDELEALRFVPMSEGRLLLAVVTESNPDQFTQRFALFDLSRGCAVRAAERLRLPVPVEVVGPKSVPGGVRPDPGGVGVRVVDEPRLVALDGIDGEVHLLLGVRERAIAGTSAEVVTGERELNFLRPVALRARWVPPPTPVGSGGAGGAGGSGGSGGSGGAEATGAGGGGADPAAEAEPSPGESATPDDSLRELVDGDPGTMFVLREGEGGTLVVSADAPVRVLEIGHGCRDDPPEAVGLRLGDVVYELGSGRPPPGSFVRAAGRGRNDPESGARRELLALFRGQEVFEFELVVSPGVRCLRDVRGFEIVEP